MKDRTLEIIGKVLFAIGYAGILMWALVGIMLLITGCSRQVPTEEPRQERALPWCVAGEFRSREQVEVCTERRRTCQTLQRKAALYGAAHLASIGECRREHD